MSVDTHNEKLEKYLDTYLGPNTDRGSNDELEARFGTKNPITQIQFDDVIAKLKSLGYAMENLMGIYRLTIQPEYTDPNSGYTMISNILVKLEKPESTTAVQGNKGPEAQFSMFVY